MPSRLLHSVCALAGAGRVRAWQRIPARWPRPWIHRGLQATLRCGPWPLLDQAHQRRQSGLSSLCDPPCRCLHLNSSRRKLLPSRGVRGAAERPARVPSALQGAQSLKSAAAAHTSKQRRVQQHHQRSRHTTLLLCGHYGSPVPTPPASCPPTGVRGAPEDALHCQGRRAGAWQRGLMRCYACG